MNRANAYMDKKDYEKAIADYTSAIELEPNNAIRYWGRGDAYQSKGDNEKAIADFTTAIKLKPDEAWFYQSRARVLATRKDFDKSIADYTEAIRLKPVDYLADCYCGRAGVYAKKGQYDKALGDYAEALRVRPAHYFAYADLAWLWATCPESKIRNGQKAVEYATKACELTRWKGAYFLNTLAAAYAEVGNFPEAIKWQKKALEEPELPKSFGEQARPHLELYQQGKPYRDLSLGKQRASESH
jgi:tetratricopeptide (TPR) repeat protein